MCVKLPEAPWITIENVPIDALLVADKASVLVAVVLPGLKEAVTPRGRLEADKLTLPAKPFCGVTVMVDVTFAPRARLSELGEAERAKSVTVSESVVLCDNAPDLPVIVTVKVPRIKRRGHTAGQASGGKTDASIEGILRDDGDGAGSLRTPCDAQAARRSRKRVVARRVHRKHYRSLAA